jgi:predicted SAM-dependent methyltransferase
MKLITPTKEYLVQQLGCDPRNPPIIQPESKFAHKYLDGLQGIEIGAASYMPFGLNAINVCTPDENDRSFYKHVQMLVAGCYYEVDIEAEADNLHMFENDSLDFIVASHVIEHTSNPIKVFLEWKRVVRPGGFIFMIVPKRDAPYGDEKRQITPMSQFMRARVEDWNNNDAYKNMLDRPEGGSDRMRGHVWVFDFKSIQKLVRICNEGFDLDWIFVAGEETDDMDGLGHMVLFQNV